MAKEINGSFKISEGNLTKLFYDLSIMLKNHPDAKFEITDGETTLKKEQNG